jgi:hypothetical protein
MKMVFEVYIVINKETMHNNIYLNLKIINNLFISPLQILTTILF